MCEGDVEKEAPREGEDEVGPLKLPQKDAQDEPAEGCTSRQEVVAEGLLQGHPRLKEDRKVTCTFRFN